MNDLSGRLPYVPVQLSREPQASGDTTHDLRHNGVQVVERRLLDLERPLGYVVQSFVIDAERHVAVFHELVDR